MADSDLAKVMIASRRFNVRPRTAYRWIAAGVNVQCPLEVATHLLKMHSASPLAIDAAIEFLISELKL